MTKQKILTAKNNYIDLDLYFEENNINSVFIVCGNSFKLLEVGKYFGSLNKRKGIRTEIFSDFQPNPSYESVVEGIKCFRKSDCSMIVAVGGGSAIDVAKCIKLYANAKDDKCYLEQKIIPNNINFLAVPTTAGTGSEATRYAVIYYKGEKKSVTDLSCIPTAVLMDYRALQSLPDYQKKSAMLDALCHSIESFWSVNSTEESKKYSKKAIQMITTNINSYLSNEDEGCKNMLIAANIAGKAINITQTTAGHAMSYKLTSLYKITHGHAAALCVSKLWKFMIEHQELCIDVRGTDYLLNVYKEIASAMGIDGIYEAIKKYDSIVDSLNLPAPKAKEDDFDILKNSVNAERLKNNPVKLDINTIDELYRQIFK